MTLNDRTALMTGGGSGRGRAIAVRFAEEGARVIVNDLNPETARETVAAMKLRGRAIQADVSDGAQVAAMFGEIEKEFRRLDILVNNAGIGEAAGEELERLNQKFKARVAETLSGPGRPDPVGSGQTPLGRWGEPAEVASDVLFLVSDESSFITGQWISPNGGLFIG